MAGLQIETRGRGPDLVLLHGWGLHGGVWAPVAQALAQRYRLHQVDLPGFGGSPLPAGEYTLERLAQIVMAAVPERADWVGWSLGGLVALAAAGAGAPIRRLALVASTPRFVTASDWPHGIAPAVLEAFAASLAQDYRATLQRFLALQARGSERAREELRHLRDLLFAHGEPRSEALSGGLRLLHETDLRARLAEITQPVLLLQGERDTLVPPGAAEAAASALPAGRVRYIAGAGHAPFISHPEAFIHELEAFLDA